MISSLVSEPSSIILVTYAKNGFEENAAPLFSKQLSESFSPIYSSIKDRFNMQS